MFIIVSFFIGQLNIVYTKSNKLKQYYISQAIEANRNYDSLNIVVIKERLTTQQLNDSISHMLTFNDENVKRYLAYFNIANEKYVYSQSLLETGYFSSMVFRQNNNLFGMKEAYSRATTSIGSDNNHAVYTSYIESIKDYKIYQDYYYNGEHYPSFLIDKSYATDPVYAMKLSKIYNDIRRKQCY